MALDVELSEIRDVLERHEPFASLPSAVLDQLPRELSIEYFRRGSRLITRGEANARLFILRSGAADVHDADGTFVDRGEEGACFGAITLRQGGASTFDVTAIEDSLALTMPKATFVRLLAAHPAFESFFDAQRQHRMRGAVAALQESSTGGAVLKTRVRDLARIAPITAPGTMSIRDAACVMADRGISSLLVVEGERLAGLVTDRDLRTRVVAAGADPLAPVETIMTRDPITGSADALAFEALLEMVGRRIHHLPIVDAQGRPTGMITTTDLVRLEQANPVYLVGDITKQSDVAGVATVAARLPAVVESLVGQDASADDIGRIVTAVGDAVERRILALAQESLGPAPGDWCWVTLGSRARLEQALAADQDHALILADDIADEATGWFTEFAALASDGLEQAGYPRCRGDIMATNPAYRMRLSQWRTAFSRWIQQPTPEAVLNAGVFFDLRSVAGDPALAESLQDHLLALTPGSRVFLAHLASAATRNAPPLGFFRGFVFERAGEHKDRLDIKRGGIGSVVELARVYALELGSPAVNTQARLAAAEAAGMIGAERGADLRDAFEFVSYVRLRHQAAQVRAGQGPDNFVRPDDLSSFDKRHLREAFAIIREAQSALGRQHSVQLMS
ncbi:MAG: cyclic nucleotide-binding/CBS domain-containing protein [Phycicoccus sp.]|nr:cyclic nucleotide-binding/CBS domain-containing protein [Phycicoccus sp.]